jgi:hypothetical protein
LLIQGDASVVVASEASLGLANRMAASGTIISGNGALQIRNGAYNNEFFSIGSQGNATTG